MEISQVVVSETHPGLSDLQSRRWSRWPMTRPRAKSYGFQGSERVGIVLWKEKFMVGVEVVSFRHGVV